MVLWWGKENRVLDVGSDYGVGGVDQQSFRNDGGVRRSGGEALVPPFDIGGLFALCKI